jgi:hypothetical protein
MNRFIASCVPASLLLLPLLAVADTNGPPRVSPGSATTLDTIVVTCSYIRRRRKIYWRRSHIRAPFPSCYARIRMRYAPWP